ncbi:MAG: response regulator transcription factor [Saprospiraceae bacterium]|nr:response regulator transcription factor [Saprospiraceae bacterium]MCB9322508.1 response regulator transcription factor [Lewinellaceae bacterium]
MKITCIAVDDEPIALEIIKEYCSKIPSLELIKVFDNPFEAIAFLEVHKPELVFFDINMPEMTGIQLVGRIKDCPPVIFTTAYSKFAVESYNLDAIDYLLKPFDFDRFYKSVQKAKKFLEADKDKVLSADEAFIIVKVEYKNVKIPISEITYLEAMDNYVKIHVGNTYHMTQQSLKKLLNQLPGEQFCRVHKSFVVPFSKINFFTSTEITLGKVKIPVGRTYQKDFMEKMEA